ncbi:hypothetical protein Peur_012503 [Populus x canadensis]
MFMVEGCRCMLEKLRPISTQTSAYTFSSQFSFRYTAEKFVKFEGLQDADQPEIRLPSTLDIWKPIIEEGLA